MEKKINVGDRVMCTDNGALGFITSIDIDPIGVCDGYTVLFDDGEETWICADMVVHSDEPPYDPKTAFLSELKGLLEKYNTHLIAHKTDMPISVYFEGEEEPCATIGKEVNKDCGIVITADNIMDYDKE